jgi:enamine deaminase RidA (YjgF/YER057c/UK114 family)
MFQIGETHVQAQQIFRNIQASLAAVGGEMDDVVSIVTYVTTPDELRDIHEVRTGFFSPPYPLAHAKVWRFMGLDNRDLQHLGRIPYPLNASRGRARI